jgi:hypothetical protein
MPEKFHIQQTTTTTTIREVEAEDATEAEAKEKENGGKVIISKTQINRNIGRPNQATSDSRPDRPAGNSGNSALISRQPVRQSGSDRRG